MGELASLTGSDNYFEDFEVGAVFRHARGKTITPLENVLITNMVLNTAHRRADAHAFYEALGYEHTGRRYAKQLV